MFLITIIFTDSDVWEMRPELRGANVSGRAVIGVTLVQSVWCKLNELNHPTQTGTFVYSSLLFNTEFNLLSLLVRALLMPLISDRCLEADMRQSICQRRASCHNITVIMFSVCYMCVLQVSQLKMSEDSNPMALYEQLRAQGDAVREIKAQKGSKVSLKGPFIWSKIR